MFQPAEFLFQPQDFVQNLLKEAVQRKASDIHFEPYENSYRVRFRIDGLLHEVACAPQSMSERITAYLKVMAHLDTAEHRLPQDGRFQEGHCRISTCPTVTGEKVVIRLLHEMEQLHDISMLGLNDQQYTLFSNALNQPQGMILVTGPTGSGKTMTLYSALHYLNQVQKNISTVEEPVEIKISGINQVNVNLKAGLTFPKVVRAFLRQDPDVIMIGEIRDLETAQIAITAAQTGHLVLSTLHSNGVLETIPRLVYMGIPAFQIADAVRLIVAQRLVRKLCAFCQGRVCAQCHQGYRGRTGVFEILPVTPFLAEKIAAGADQATLYALTKESGMVTLSEAGLEKIRLNMTTSQEVKRVMGS